MNEFKDDTAVMQLPEVGMPTLKADEVLIKVRAATISHVEVSLCKRRGEEEPLIHECSGRIIEVGSSVTRWHIGDKVCALLNGIRHADEVVVSSKRVLCAPLSISLETAASVPVDFCSTYYAINKCLELRKGDILVILGEVYRFTIYAIEMAKCCGMRVFVVGANERLLESYKEYGADACINFRKENVVEQVRRMSGMKGAAAVIMYHGPNSHFSYAKCLAKDGVFLIVWDGLFAKPDTEAMSVILKVSCKVCDIYSLVRSIMDEKSVESLVREVEKNVWPAIDQIFHQFTILVPQIMMPTEMELAVKQIERSGGKVILATKEVSWGSKLLSKAREKLFKAREDVDYEKLKSE